MLHRDEFLRLIPAMRHSIQLAYSASIILAKNSIVYRIVSCVELTWQSPIQKPRTSVISIIDILVCVTFECFYRIRADGFNQERNEEKEKKNTVFQTLISADIIHVDCVGRAEEGGDFE